MSPEGKSYYSDDRRRAGEKFMNAEQERSKEESLKSKVAIAKVAIGDVMHAIGEKMTRPARYVKDRVSSWYDRRFNKKSESGEQSEAKADDKPEYKLPDDVNDLLQRFSRGEADLDDVTKGLAHSREQANKAREAEQKAKLEAKPEVKSEPKPETEKPKAESEEKKHEEKPETGDAKGAKPNSADGGEATSTTGDRPNRFKLPDLKVPDLKLQPEGDIPHSDFEPKPKAKPEVKPESKAESKPEVKPEPKSEAKPEAKPEVKPESKPETKGSANTESQQRPFFAYNKNGDLTQYSSREAYERAVAEDQKAAETESKGDTEATEEKYIPLSPEERRDGMEQLRGMHNVIMAAVTSYDVTRASQVINAYSEMLTSYANRGLDVDQLRLSSEDLQRIMYNAMIKEMSYARQTANRQPNFKPIANGAPDVWGNSGGEKGSGESGAKPEAGQADKSRQESLGERRRRISLEAIHNAIEGGRVTEAQLYNRIDFYNNLLINDAANGEKVGDAMLRQGQIAEMVEQLRNNIERNKLRDTCDGLVGQLRAKGLSDFSKGNATNQEKYNIYNKFVNVIMRNNTDKEGNINKDNVLAECDKAGIVIDKKFLKIFNEDPKRFARGINGALDDMILAQGAATFDWSKVNPEAARWYMSGVYDEDLENNRKLSKFDIGRDGHNTEQKKSEAEQKAEAKPETEQKKSETKTEAKPETEKPKSDAKPESKPETEKSKAESEEKKPEAKPEAEQKADAKPEAKSETKPETEQSKAESEEKKPEAKPEPESEPKPESKSDAKPEAKPEPEQKSDQESKADEEAAYNELDQKMEREQAVFSGAMDGIDRFQRSINDWRFQQGVESGHAVSNEDMQQQFGDLYGLFDVRSDKYGHQLPIRLTPEGRKMAFQMAAAEYDNSHDSAANGKHAAEAEQAQSLDDLKQHVEAFNQFNAARQAKNEKPVSFYSYLVMNK